MINKNWSFFLIFLLIIPFVYADYDCRFEIFTNPFSEVSIKVLYDFGENTGRMINNQSSLYNVSDKNGRAVFNYRSKEPVIRLSIKVNEEMEEYKEFRNVLAGNNVFIDMTVSNPIPVRTPLTTTSQNSVTNTQVNNSQVNSQVINSINPTPTIINNSNQTPIITTPVKEEKDSDTTQKTLNNPTKSFNYKFWVILSLSLILLAVIGVLIVLFIKKRKNNHSSSGSMDKGIRTVKFSEKFGGRVSQYDSKELKLAERKLNEAQEEINRLKSREKEIFETQRRIKEDQDRLKKLRGF